jgi:Zn-dependent protease
VTVARLLGMPVRLSPALAALVVLGVVAAVWWAPAEALLVAAGVGLSLLAHELAHGLAARRLGYDVDYLELGLLGGRTAWSGPTPDAPTALTIAAAGPACSALIAVVAELAGSRPLAAINLLVAVTNLLPVTGSDGWVIWRAATAPATSSAPEPE